MGLSKKAIIISLMYSACFFAHALDITKLNLTYQYDTSDRFDFKHRIAQSEGRTHIYYKVDADSPTDYQAFLLLQDGYESTSHDTLTSYTLDTLAFSATSGSYRLTLPPTNKNLLLISIVDLNKGVYRIYDIQITSPSGFPGFMPLASDGKLVLKNYTTSESISVPGNDRYHIYRYKDDFEAADPAMGMMKPIAPSLTIDSSFYFQDELSGLKPYHFYLIQTDTLADNGVTLLKCPSYYPKYKKLEELIGPLTYITTPNENKALNNQMNKQAFEKFWLNTYGTKFRAKSAIKFFYDRVEQANALFTDYKQGWKTDRGMLYIVFGKPEQVTRSERNEIWRYNEGIEFEFIRISTLFTPSLYSLKRNRKYEELWYEQVGNIRKGL